ncbi:phycobilisome rod-core linker polypeptide [Tumidithrix elongata RA019]|uniref:Phycobilisome rod-core linker polypeptide n=1 Tax=Tumidithrix elongata BACA0141 TaxID=2716417 RepID=A0AAW9PSP9_9CYAN|nr:phycobilisome rod-core linker polypeptide [Tumidithrix elongata RA019]
MTIPLLEYAPLSPNQRVKNFDVPTDESPRIYSTDNILSPSDMGTLIDVAYRQIFFHAFATDREPVLESQLRGGQITVRDFIRGLLLSNTYRTSFYELNSNYRFVEHTVQKVLGRDVYGEREKIAWSAVVMTKGIAGFVDELLNSEEYLSNFGYDTVPYHRRRILPSQTIGERPFNIKSPRYDAYYRAKFGFPQFVWQSTVRSYNPAKTYTAGNPSAFLDMAQSISPRGGQAQRISSLNIDIEKSLPRR